MTAAEAKVLGLLAELTTAVDESVKAYIQHDDAGLGRELKRAARALNALSPGAIEIPTTRGTVTTRVETPASSRPPNPRPTHGR